MRGMTCDKWQHITYFASLMILLELNDVSLLILTLNDALFPCRGSKKRDFLKSY